MSYADIAGLDYVYGLYAAAVPAIVYAWFGSSGQLAVGPVAIVSILIEAGLADKLPRGECPEYYDDDRRRLKDSLAETCPNAYAKLVFVCMFLVGVIQVVGALHDPAHFDDGMVTPRQKGAGSGS